VTRFADVSHIRLSAVTNWAAFLASVDGVGFKCTQGTFFADPLYRDGLARARAANKLVLHYHYVGPSPGPGGGPPASPAAETSWFLQHLDWRPGEILATDWEPAVKPADSDGWLAEFNARIAAALGPVPVSYMNSFEAKRLTWAKTRAGGSAWWAAQYGINNGVPGAPPTGAWPSFAAWQFTSAAALPGLPGGTDLSLFYGDAPAWRAYGSAASPGGLTLATLTDAQAQQLLADVANIKGFLYAGGPSTLAPIGPDGAPVLADGVAGSSLFGRVANIQQALTVALTQLTPEQIAAAIGQLPAADAEKIAGLVLQGVDGARITIPTAA
jgi:GH25 family lysozyme M1 (1,4-beta-N-acetylmuramidase)